VSEEIEELCRRASIEHDTKILCALTETIYELLEQDAREKAKLPNSLDQFLKQHYFAN
jgi:hypothetical protein